MHKVAPAPVAVVVIALHLGTLAWPLHAKPIPLLRMRLLPKNNIESNTLKYYKILEYTILLLIYVLFVNHLYLLDRLPLRDRNKKFHRIED